MPLCNCVFAGGGVKGIGHVGAVCALEARGYEFDRVAGSSAGAIVAALLAAGYRGIEMKDRMESIDYTKFAQKDALDRIGILGKATSVLWHYGIYHSEYLEKWLTVLLKQKGICCFEDVDVKMAVIHFR